MAETEKLQVARREETGKRRVRRMRQAGRVPAILYGHGEESIKLSIPTEQIDAALRHGAHLVDLEGDLNESALIRDIQWDTFGTEVLHLDLTRVSKTELVEVTLPVETRGVAPGLREGGVVQQPLHELEIECPAGSIPESIVVNINELSLDQAVHAKELEIPSGARLITPADAVVVQCVMPTVIEAPEEEVAEGAEPEVIGRKEEEGEGEED